MNTKTLWLGFAVACSIISLLVSFVALNRTKADKPDEVSLGATDRTTLTNPFVFQDTVSMQSTTTVTRSYDGFMAGGGITPASMATGTVFALYTHAGGPAMCDASVGTLYADSTAFSPALVLSIGTSTGATATTNLVSSTTLATTSDAIVLPTASHFVLNAGDRINAYLGDYITNASSTNYGNWDIEFQVPCWLIGG